MKPGDHSSTQISSDKFLSLDVDVCPNHLRYLITDNDTSLNDVFSANFSQRERILKQNPSLFKNENDIWARELLLETDWLDWLYGSKFNEDDDPNKSVGQNIYDLLDEDNLIPISSSFSSLIHKYIVLQNEKNDQNKEKFSCEKSKINSGNIDEINNNASKNNKKSAENHFKYKTFIKKNFSFGDQFSIPFCTSSNWYRTHTREGCDENLKEISAVKLIQEKGENHFRNQANFLSETKKLYEYELVKNLIKFRCRKDIPGKPAPSIDFIGSTVSCQDQSSENLYSKVKCLRKVENSDSFCQTFNIKDVLLYATDLLMESTLLHYQDKNERYYVRKQLFPRIINFMSSSEKNGVDGSECEKTASLYSTDLHRVRAENRKMLCRFSAISWKKRQGSDYVLGSYSPCSPTTDSTKSAMEFRTIYDLNDTTQYSFQLAYGSLNQSTTKKEETTEVCFTQKKISGAPPRTGQISNIALPHLCTCEDSYGGQCRSLDEEWVNPDYEELVDAVYMLMPPLIYSTLKDDENHSSTKNIILSTVSPLMFPTSFGLYGQEGAVMKLPESLQNQMIQVLTVAGTSFYNFKKDVPNLKDTNRITNIANSFRRVCGHCGGLLYIPFSFIQLPISRSHGDLDTWLRSVVLPCHTNVFTDYRKALITFVTSNHAHETKILIGLQCAGVERQVNLLRTGIELVSCNSFSDCCDEWYQHIKKSLKKNIPIIGSAYRFENSSNITSFLHPYHDITTHIDATTGKTHLRFSQTSYFSRRKYPYTRLYLKHVSLAENKIYETNHKNFKYISILENKDEYSISPINNGKQYQQFANACNQNEINTDIVSLYDESQLAVRALCSLFQISYVSDFNTIEDGLDIKASISNFDEKNGKVNCKIFESNTDTGSKQTYIFENKLHSSFRLGVTVAKAPVRLRESRENGTFSLPKNELTPGTSQGRRYENDRHKDYPYDSNCRSKGPIPSLPRHPRSPSPHVLHKRSRDSGGAPTSTDSGDRFNRPTSRLGITDHDWSRKARLRSNDLQAVSADYNPVRRDRDYHDSNRFFKTNQNATIRKSGGSESRSRLSRSRSRSPPFVGISRPRGNYHEEQLPYPSSTNSNRHYKGRDRPRFDGDNDRFRYNNTHHHHRSEHHHHQQQHYYSPSPEEERRHRRYSKEIGNLSSGGLPYQQRDQHNRSRDQRGYPR